MQRFRRIMVALTRSERDQSLIRYAALIARLGKPDEVRFVHVPGTENGVKAKPHDELAAELSGMVSENFAGVPESVERHFHILRGSLIDGLLSFAAEQHADLIFVGHRPGHRPGRKALIRRLTMKAPCSVWIVPDGSAPEISRVLVPVDFSEHSADALDVAAGVANLAGAMECIALHVYHTNAVITYEESAPIVKGQEEEAFERFIAPVNLHGVKVRPVFIESEDIADTIHKVAREQEADLKVMPTRGRSRSAAILLGSVAEGVIVEARTPLLIVKHFGAKLNLLETLLDRAFRRDSPHFN